MSYRKTAFELPFGISQITALMGTGLISILMAQNVSANPLPPNPVMTAVWQQLGIKPQSPSKTRTLSDEDEALLEKPFDDLTLAEKLKVQYQIRRPSKVEKTAAKKTLKKNQKNPTRKKTDKQALAAFYAQSDRQPIWVGSAGHLPKSLAVIAEFKHADNYGLRPRDFTLADANAPALVGKMPKPSFAQLAKIEISVSRNALKYARYAKGGRIDPRKLSRFQDRGPILPDPEKVLATLAKTDKPVQVLRSYHPQHKEFKALRKKLASLSGSSRPVKRKKTTTKLKFPINGPTLRLGTKHAQVALLRKRLGLKPANDHEFDDVLLAGVKTFQKKNGLGRDGVVGPGTRLALSGATSRKSSPEKLRARLLINMERWRWMPKRMQGNNNIFVWANVPELQVRIIRNGKAVFTEKAIAGQLSKQSPMFSDKMEWIEFNPTWFIPNSIKVADILPSLRGKGRVMSRYHLRIDCGKHGKDYTKIDWKKVDIRKCSVIQPTGAKSVLGKLKFKFPNKHAVYMHDTLTPGLFNRKHRILSHGCIRVRNPRRMAEVLLANDKGMSAKRVGSFLARGGLHTERLKRSIPVHITYFSTRIKEDGSLSNHPDYYGHDKRLAQAMLGKGHLFSGAIYSGRKKYVRKPRPKPAPSPSTNPAFFPEQ